MKWNLYAKYLINQRWLALLIIAFGILAYSYNVIIVICGHSTADLNTLYLSGKMLNVHFHHIHPPPHISPASYLTPGYLPNLAPPFFTMLVSYIVPHTSYVHFFLAFTVFSIAIDIFFLTRLFQYFYSGRTIIIMACLFILLNFLYIPTFYSVMFGQVTLLLNALTIAAYLSLAKKRDITAGCLLALAANIKIFFGLFFFYLLAQKRYQAILAFIICCSLLALIPLCIFGWEATYSGYMISLNKVHWYMANWNASFYGVLCRIFGDSSYPQQAALLPFPNIGKYIYYFIFVLYLSLVYYVSRKEKNQFELAFAFTLSTMLLISPLGWSYYFPMMVTAFLITFNTLQYKRCHPWLKYLMFATIFITSIPFDMHLKVFSLQAAQYAQQHVRILPFYHPEPIVSLHLLLIQGGLLFLALFILNSITLMQILRPVTQKIYSVWGIKRLSIIITICLLPSLVGIINIVIQQVLKT